MNNRQVLMSSQAIFEFLQEMMDAVSDASLAKSVNFGIENITLAEQPISLQEMKNSEVGLMVGTFNRHKAEYEKIFQEFAKNIRSAIRRGTEPKRFVAWEDVADLAEKAIRGHAEITGPAMYQGLIRARIYDEMNKKANLGVQRYFDGLKPIYQMAEEESEAIRNKLTKKLRHMAKEFVEKNRDSVSQQPRGGTVIPLPPSSLLK